MLGKKVIYKKRKQTYDHQLLPLYFYDTDWSLTHMPGKKYTSPKRDLAKTILCPRENPCVDIYS